MTRFNSTDEVIAAAESAARDDYQRHLPVHTDPDGAQWQVDLNPYRTQGARSCWQRGFDGAKAQPRDGDLRWNFKYQRGAAAARIIKEQA